MILVRAPLRISLLGGGSDLPAFYRQGQPGHTVSLTIAESVYVTVQPTDDGRTRLHYRQIEDVATLTALHHDRAREALRVANMCGVEIHSIADVPAGSGLGSSSAFTVALLTALGAGDPETVAALACEVEIDRCGHPIGKQDQYASAFGGLRRYSFWPDETVTSQPLYPPDLAAFVRRLWLVPVGGRHDASQILRSQGQALTHSAARGNTQTLANLALAAADALERGQVDQVGEMLDAAWALKKGLAPGITSGPIDALVRDAKDAGALGVKLCGAGGAGFLLVYAPASGLSRELPGMRPVTMQHEGTRVVYRGEVCGR